MPLLTKKLDFPSHSSSIGEYQYGIGLCTDDRQSYFYCCTSSTNGYVCATADSSIFRLGISGQLHSSNNWEFVGKVDFLCRYNTITPCGKYFWSIKKEKTDCWQLLFRLVNIKTLEYETFETIELDPNICGVRYVRIHHNSLFGNFLIVGRFLTEERYNETGDMVFRFHVNKSQKSIKLEQINFPTISTVEPLAIYYDDRYCFKEFSYGIAENSFTVFFYQIDYFGDLFVLELSDKPLKWTKFTVEGDQFETWMNTEDRDLPNRQPRNALNGWSYCEHNKVYYNTRVYFENGYLCCTRSFDRDQRRTYFYRCDFNIETHVCRSKRIFSTYDKFNPMYKYATLSKDNGLETLFLCTRNKNIFCEQIILNGVPTLLNLTYLATSRMVEERRKTRTVNLSMENAESVTVSNAINQQPTWKKSILQWFQRRFTKKKRETPSTINESKSRTVIKLESNICKEQETTVFPIVTYSQVNDLLNELNNIFV